MTSAIISETAFGSLFKNNCCFSVQEHVGHYIIKSTETGLDFFTKYLLRAIYNVKASLVIISSSTGGDNSSSCTRSGGGRGSDSDSTSGCGRSSKILTWAGKYKLGARASKYKLRTWPGPRACEYKDSFKTTRAV